MPYHHPFEVIGFHSCDREVGLAILNGDDELKPSDNDWDWLGNGIYFWEQNPYRALDYAIKCAKRQQFNKVRIKTPFVLGAIIELGNCFNLVTPDALNLLTETYRDLESVYKKAGKPIPKNVDAKRELDCAVIRYVHEINKIANKPSYDSVRCAFGEGGEAYPTSNFTTELHIQICLRNHALIKGYFLPIPIERFNPYLHKDII